MERVFDICHGCRRCVSLCDAFPTLFDLVDESPTMELDGVDKKDFGKVVDACYLCDLCYQVKCPYVPPHEWELDFPHLMLRAKAKKFRDSGAPLNSRVLSSTDAVGRLATIPILNLGARAATQTSIGRQALKAAVGVHHQAPIPSYTGRRLSRRRQPEPAQSPAADAPKVAIVPSCYCEFNEPEIAEDLLAVLRHNGAEVRLLEHKACCGMPKMELGDLERVEQLKDANIPQLAELAASGWALITPVPSCNVMYRNELPLLFPEDERVQRVRGAMRDVFEFLSDRHRADALNLEFKNPLGQVAYQVACHQRVQNIGPRTKQVLELVPDTQVLPIERCSGHDGTYGVRTETYETAQKIARPVARQVLKNAPDAVTSDCPMASAQIAHAVKQSPPPSASAGQEPAAPARNWKHPISLLRHAYGI